MTTSLLLFSGVLIGIVIMFFSWRLAVRLNFYSLVDVAWSFGVGLIAVIYGFLGQGEVGRRMLFSALALVWSVRLGTHLWLRLKIKFPEEDLRYTKIKDTWQESTKRKFFWFFQFQAISQPILCIPFMLASQSVLPLSWIDILAVGISFVGVIGESISDMQLKKFKSKSQNKGLVCDSGLWRYSRHPNYFFEWIIWCGFSCFGFSNPQGYLSLISPTLMFVLLNYVTGVPPAEEQSLSSKREFFQAYQKRTNRFFPWVPREN